MTARKHFKQLVRDRMRKHRRAYTVARRHVAAPAPVVGAARRRPRRHGGVRQRAREPRRRARRRAADRGDGAGRRRRARRRLHPLGVRAHGYRALDARLPARSGSTRRAGRPRPPRGSACTPRSTRPAAQGRGRGARRAARPRAARDRLGRRRAARPKGEPAWREGHGGPPVVVYARAGDSYLIDDRSSGARRRSRPTCWPRRAARVVSYKNRLIAIDPERVDLRPGARGRGGPAAAGRAPERDVGLVLVAGLAQVGADDQGHAQQEGLAERVRRRARDGSAARVDLHGRGRAARTCAGSTPTSWTRRGAARDRVAERGVAGAAAAWEAIVDAALPPGDELREAIDTPSALARRGDAARSEMLEAARRWALQAERDEGARCRRWREPVRAMHAAEVAALEACGRRSEIAATARRPARSRGRAARPATRRA